MTPGTNSEGCAGWFLTPRRERVHTAYPAKVDTMPRARHGRTANDDTPQRERIRRPLDSAPRRGEDWQ